MTKKEVQQRVLQNGKPLALRKFTWCEKTRTFSTKESYLVLDFDGIDCCNFNTGYNCTFKTSYNCNFYTGFGCTFKTWSNCTFKTGSGCIFKTGDNCNFTTGDNCTFNTGDNCTFKTGDNCTFNATFSCNFDTGFGCTFNIWKNGNFVNKSKNNVVVVRYGNDKQIYDLDLLEKNKLIRLSIDSEPLVE